MSRQFELVEQLNLFMVSFERNCIKEVEAFLFPNFEHLSTFSIILAHVHQREKLFRSK